MEHAVSFGLTVGQARDEAARVRGAVEAWRTVASANGIPRGQLDVIADAFRPDLLIASGA